VNFIHCVKDVYPQESCKNLIEWFNTHTHLQKKGTVGQERESLNNLEICICVKEHDDFYGLGHALKKGINNFIATYPYTDKYLGKWRLDLAMQLMKYKPNQYYSSIHCENDGLPSQCYRAFAWMIFLNTIKKGGGTKFMYQNIIAKPVAGDFYMWPAGWTHLHRGVNAPKETKYIITGWCSYTSVILT